MTFQDFSKDCVSTFFEIVWVVSLQKNSLMMISEDSMIFHASLVGFRISGDITKCEEDPGDFE